MRFSKWYLSPWCQLLSFLYVDCRHACHVALSNFINCFVGSCLPGAICSGLLLDFHTRATLHLTVSIFINCFLHCCQARRIAKKKLTHTMHVCANWVSKCETRHTWTVTNARGGYIDNRIQINNQFQATLATHTIDAM